MIKDLVFILNELTERGLQKEASYLHDVFNKIAYESVERAEALLNSANPKRNHEPKERSIAADRLAALLKNPDRPEFGYKELAGLISEKGVQDTFDSEEFLGGVLTNAEVSVLKQLLSRERGPRGGGFRRPRWERAYQERAYQEQQQEEGSGHSSGERSDYGPADIELINKILDAMNGTVRTVRLKRSSGVSDAYVFTRNGDLTTFVVPVSDIKLGYKILTTEHLIEDSFLFLNQDLVKIFKE